MLNYFFAAVVIYLVLCLLCLVTSWFKEGKFWLWPFYDFPIGLGLFLLLPVIYGMEAGQVLGSILMSPL